jgi:flagellar basal-body rod protein FlgG
MTDVLAISLHGMQQEMARLQRISMNMANATTPAYKREVASALPLGPGSFPGAMDEASDALRGARGEMPGASSGAPPGVLLIQPDTRPGTLKTTGQRLDVALSSQGYFEIATEEGLAYTRQGSWQLDARGRLVTPQGHPVMGLGGEIVLTRPNPVIDATGQVFESRPDGGAESTSVAQLKVVQFDNPQELRRVGDALMQTDQPPVQLSDTEVEVRQGFLENSNVNSMQEMVQLVRSMRHFESMQKVALGYDEMMGSAIRKLGDLS